MFQEDDYLAEMASPSSSSVAETILPTPDQPYSSRRSSLASPQVMDPAHHDDGDRDTCCPPDDSVAKDRQDVNASTSPASSAKPQPIISVDRAQRPFSTSTSMSNRSIRNASNPNPRAPPPPPILLRRPTDIDSAHVEDIPLRTGSSGGAGSPSRSNARGLNIAGLAPVLDGSVEPETREEQDALHALPVVLPSPRRPFFAGADNHGAPKSPAWQSFEVAQSRAPASPNKGRRQSTELPFSPLGPNANVLNLPANPLTPSRFDPTPQHGIHARNMSLFFPTPGQPSSDKLSVPPTPNFASAEGTAVMQAPHAGSKHKMPFGGSGEWTFGRAGGGTATGTQETSRSKRRGHHHKHSLSHNFFSFLDPTQTNPALARSPSPAVPSPRVLDTPQPVPMPMLATPHLLPGSPTLIPLPPSKNNPKRQLLMSLSAMECLIGAALWIEAWRSVRRPYGFARLTALLYFTQSLFLVFAAVYIAKESLESVVLGADAHEHGHTEISEGADRPFPRLLLLVAACTTSFAGSYLGNHQKLVDAVGPLFLPYRYMTSLLVKKGPTFLGNPFSVTTTGMCSVALLGSVIVPS
ncbi:hypothetical protein BD324DRAFT_48356 [Kockovaella imperatae]|uniref:Uncharacterized protein n=1 Tax=Kockovaella imperatae TaxID=4999 RepID=A0A1Y1UT53_9TREE|nr:hypothetical protein BD324DRAFT_48356 [Kockovaella imperatae]ORX41191.1 hypothetical protein BD324DRAFT_48356 [Kockovaella imperatae]